MHEVYYDRWEFMKAYDLIHTNPIQAKKSFEEYIDKYPYDYSAQKYYIYTLIVLGNIEEAKNFLNKLEKSIDNDSNFCNFYDKIEYVNKGIFLNRIRLYAIEKEYKELYAYYIRNRHLFDDSDLLHIPFYCRSILGLLNKEKDYSSYYYGQIVHYSNDEFLKHIERHTADYNMDLDEPNSSIFAPSFPLDMVLNEIKKYIPSNNGLSYGFFEDTYIFRYDECGRSKNKLVDFFKVICFRDNGNLLTMYPSKDCENLPYTDFNYLVKEDKPKIKTLSQIEKFNRRYKR